VPNRRTRKLTEATAEAVAHAEERGVTTPLAHMMAILNDPAAAQQRKDQMAIASAPFMHPRLAMTASVDPANGGGVVASVTVIGVPRGCQYDPVSGLIKYADGLECSPPAFAPLLPSPDVVPVDSDPNLLEPTPLPVIEPEPEADGKVTPLSAWRKKSDEDGSAS
jgi:hypothetical protein